MASLAEDFCTKFHSLEGVTIAERRKQFFTLLHQNATLRDYPEALDLICVNLHPNTYLESLFKVDFLIYFKRKQELFNLLKEGNDVFVSKICKQIWFFKESFNDVEADELVNEILPCMSFSVRTKVLKKLSQYLSSEKFDGVFEAFAARYGIFRASKFIAGCTPLKIRQVLRQKSIRLTTTQLRILHCKDRELIEFYFTYFDPSPHYQKFYEYIYIKDPNLFNYLKEKYKITLWLGRRASKKFALVNKQEIIQKPHEFPYLNMKAVIRKLGKDSLELFCNALPASLSPLNKCSWLFTNFPQRYHYSLFIKTFQNHYNIKFENNPTLIDKKLLDLIPHNSERAVLAKVKVDAGFDEYLKYLTTSDSIPLIKEKINLTSDIYNRGQLIKFLIETCHINNDMDALLSVMKYFCFRHRNDELEVHLEFINTVEYIIGFKKFTEEMWSVLNELLTIHMLKYDETDSTHEKIQTLPLVSFNRGTSSHQKLSYLEFLFKKGDSIDSLILEYFSADINTRFPIWDKYNRKFGKYFLIFCIQNLSKGSSDKRDIDFNDKLIQEIIKWNRSYENDHLSLYDFPQLFQTFDYMIKNCRPPQHITGIFRSKIFTLADNKYKNDYLQIYWKRFDTFGSCRDIIWFLKYDPQIIINNFDKVFHLLVLKNPDSRDRLITWYIFKKFSHLHFDQKSVESCLLKLNDKSCIDKKSNFVACLSVLMKPTEYAAFADGYKPVNKKLDLRNQAVVRLYNLQCSIAGQFRNTKSYEVFDSLMHFCAGDYFKYALRSLYCIMYRTPETMLPRYLENVSTSAVSVRKHALFLTCELSPIKTVETMIQLLNKKEKVLSLQKHIFSSTIQYFVKNPSDTVFHLIKQNMLFISKNDEESLKSITEHFPKIPENYQAQYFHYSWEFLEKTVDVESKLVNLKKILLDKVKEETVKEIPLEFGLNIIRQHLMPENKDFCIAISFAFSFVTIRDEKEEIFKEIFTIADQCKNRDAVFKFIHTWHYKIMSKNHNFRDLAPFIDFYERNISPTEDFYDYIKVFFLRLKLELAENRSVDLVVAKVVDFFRKTVSDYGPNIICLFAKEVNSNLSQFKDEDGHLTMNDFYLSMIKNHPFPRVAILVMEVVAEPHHLANKHVISKFHQILQHVSQVKDKGVQINLHCKFKSYLKMLSHN